MIPEGARVYVVDDDVSFVRSALRLLRSWGIAATGFTDAAQLLAAVGGEAPACALVDIRMPGVSGFALQDALSRARVSLPLVFMSGHTDAELGADALRRGAIAFLTKPVDERRLLDAVERGLEASAGERRLLAAVERAFPAPQDGAVGAAATPAPVPPGNRPTAA